MWVEEKSKAAELSLGEKIPRNVIDVLQHIILAHHGEYEFGSPRLPSTPEAIAVHMIENMDAKLMMSLTATRGEGVPDGSWTEYQKAFNGKLYRPDVAPADAPLTEEIMPEPAVEIAHLAGSERSAAPAPIMSKPQPLAEPAKALLSNPLFASNAPRNK